MVNYRATIKTPDAGTLIYTGSRNIITPKITAYINSQYHMDVNLHRNKFAALVNNDKCVSRYVKNIVSIERITPRSVIDR